MFADFCKEYRPTKEEKIKEAVFPGPRQTNVSEERLSLGH